MLKENDSSPRERVESKEEERCCSKTENVRNQKSNGSEPLFCVVGERERRIDMRSGTQWAEEKRT